MLLNMRGISGGHALILLEACLRAARENPRALQWRNVFKKGRFCCLRALPGRWFLRVSEVALRAGDSPGADAQVWSRIPASDKVVCKSRRVLPL